MPPSVARRAAARLTRFDPRQRQPGGLPEIGSPMYGVLGCPHCHQKVRVSEDSLGKRVTCRVCGKSFTVDALVREPMAPPGPRRGRRERPRSPAIDRPLFPPATAKEARQEIEDEHASSGDSSRHTSKALESDEPERPRRRLTGRDRNAWRRVHTGLTLMLAAAFTLLGTWLIAVGFGVGTEVRVLPRTGGLPMGLAILTLLALFAAVMLGFVGLGFCLSAPPQHAAKAWAVAAFSLAAGTVLLAILGCGVGITEGVVVTLSRQRQSVAGVAFFLMAASTLLGTTETFVLLLFLRALARALRKEALAGTAVMLLVLLAVLVVSGVVEGIVQRSAGSLALIAFTSLFFGLGVFVILRTARVMIYLRRTVKGRLGA